MANHKSAIKRARQNIKRRERNQALRARTKTEVKKALTEILTAKSLEDGLKALQTAERVLQKAWTKGVLPKERASRKTSRLAGVLNKKFKATQANA